MSCFYILICGSLKQATQNEQILDVIYSKSIRSKRLQTATNFTLKKKQVGKLFKAKLRIVMTTSSTIPNVQTNAEIN